MSREGTCDETVDDHQDHRHDHRRYSTDQNEPLYQYQPVRQFSRYDRLLQQGNRNRNGQYQFDGEGDGYIHQERVSRAGTPYLPSTLIDTQAVSYERRDTDRYVNGPYHQSPWWSENRYYADRNQAGIENEIATSRIPNDVYPCSTTDATAHRRRWGIEQQQQQQQQQQILQDPGEYYGRRHRNFEPSRFTTPASITEENIGHDSHIMDNHELRLSVVHLPDSVSLDPRNCYNACESYHEDRTYHHHVPSTFNGTSFDDPSSSSPESTRVSYPSNSCHNNSSHCSPRVTNISSSTNTSSSSTSSTARTTATTTTSSSSTTTTITTPHGYMEILPGQYVRLRGADETWHAIRHDAYLPCICSGCGNTIFGMDDADYVVCPICREVSPVRYDDVDDDNDTTRTVTTSVSSHIAHTTVPTTTTTTVAVGGGVGLGFTLESLGQWQADIMEQNRQKR
jgi:hypothetical protein